MKKSFVKFIGALGMIFTLSSCTLNVQNPIININGNNNTGGGSTVATPVMNPVGGSYSVDTSVTISSGTSGATIHYTVDGSTPTSASAIYTAPIPIQGHGTNKTIKAIGVQDGLNDSEVLSQSYIINYNKVSTPSINPAAATYNVPQNITITSSTTGALIYYSTDGSVPTATSVSSTLYTGTFAIAKSTVLKAIAIKEQMDNSDVASKEYVLKVVTPVLSPVGASYSLNPHVTISTTTPDVDIYYTTDGTAPTVDPAKLYSGEIVVSGQGTVENIQAIAVKDGWSNSDVASETYTIDYDKVSTPSISPATGIYNSSQNVTIECLTENVDIYYTIDGLEPSIDSIHYVGEFATPSASTVVKAIAVKDEMQDSDVASNEYTLEVLAPVMSPASGDYYVDQHVTLSTDTPDAEIYYTTDGVTLPTAGGEGSTLYDSPILISGNGTTETIKAIAVKAGWNNSGVTSESYSISYYNVETPTISPVAGTYNVNQSVTITDGTAGAEIHYTTNGDTPTGSSALYTGAFTVSANKTVRAIAIKDQMNPSAVAENVYTLKAITPVMSPTGGTKTADTSVTLSTTTSGATIYYTTDGSPATTSSSVYSVPINVTGQGTVENIKAIAAKTGWTSSEPASETYTINYPVAATPSISPAAGPYNSAPFVTITSSTSGASIYYTTNGLDPTSGSTPYTGSFQLTGSSTVKAIAIKAQTQNSVVASNAYTLTVVTPVMSPASASYTVDQYVSITTTTPSATIYYTEDGTAPNVATSSVYSTPIPVTGHGTNKNIRAIAAKSGWTTSAEASETYILSYLSVATPSISPAAATYNNDQSVTITDGTSGAAIYYSTDGGTPSTLYTGAFTASSSQTVKAMATKTMMQNSAVASNAYVLQAAAPTFSPAAGSVASGTAVTLTTTTTGASIYYTTDGSTPDSSKSLYDSGSKPTVTTAITFKAIAIKSGYSNSSVASATYTITPPKIYALGNFNGFGNIYLRIARTNTDGTIDNSFNTTGGGADSLIQSLAVQSDGKVIFAGDFTTYDGTASAKIARINTDGTLDATFNPGTGTANRGIKKVALQADGKVIIGGNFLQYNGTTRNSIARVNTDGTLDTTFNPGTGASDWIQAIAVQSDGKIIIGGNFTTYNGTARNYIARVNTDGTLDATFNPGTGADGSIYTAVIQSDGKIIIGGLFANYNGTARSRIARINTDGTLDATFNPGTGTSTINTISLQSDGKIIIGGGFATYNGTARNYIARVNTDGTLDTTFNPGTGFDTTVNSSAIQGDGKIIVGGSFSSYNGTANKKNIIRINTDGTLDATFSSGAGTGGGSYYVGDIAIQSNGKAIFVGNFLSYNTTTRLSVARLNSDSTLDTTFSLPANTAIGTLAVQSDGKIMIGGNFTTYSGTARARIARINDDATLDTTFDPGTGANGTVSAIAIQSDGKIIIGGNFTTYNGTARARIARINTDGTLDTTFDPGTGADASILVILIQSDGKIVIGGQFTTYNGTSRKYISRINTDGTLDATFNPGTGLSTAFATGNTVALQSDGKIMVAGDFTTYNGTARVRIARINTDGTLDTTFNPGTGVDTTVGSLLIQSDGKIVISGSFANYNSTGTNRIARINTNGTLDASLAAPATGTAYGAASAIQSDGKIILGGNFTIYNAANRNYLVRINANGTTDTTFLNDPHSGFNSYVSAIIIK